MTRRGPSNAASPPPRVAGTRDTPLPAQCGLARCPRSRPMPVRHGVRALRPNARNTPQRAHEPPLAGAVIGERRSSFAERPRRAAMSGLRLPAARFCQVLLR